MLVVALVNVEVGVAQAQLQTVQPSLLHAAHLEWSHFSLGILSPLPDHLAVVNVVPATNNSKSVNFNQSYISIA